MGLFMGMGNLAIILQLARERQFFTARAFLYISPYTWDAPGLLSDTTFQKVLNCV
jgi:hypothetical protein